MHNLNAAKYFAKAIHKNTLKNVFSFNGRNLLFESIHYI